MQHATDDMQHATDDMQHALLRRHVLNPRTAQVDPNDPLMEKDLSLLYRLSAKKASPGADVS